jgi:hypothetical protein
VSNAEFNADFESVEKNANIFYAKNEKCHIKKSHKGEGTRVPWGFRTRRWWVF